MRVTVLETPTRSNAVRRQSAMNIYPITFFQDNRFYVYMYLRANNSKNGLAGTPYYIGKGTSRRAYQNSSRNFKAPTDKSKIQIISNNLTETEAFALEITLISLFGRIDLGTGCLRNLTNGGEGASGCIRPKEAINKSIKTRIKNNTMNVNSPESIAKAKITRKENNTPWTTPEATSKQMSTKRKNNTVTTITPESTARSVASRIANGNSKITPETVAKILNSKRINGTMNSSTPESIAKGLETKKKNNTLNTRTPEAIFKTMSTKIKNNTVDSSEKAMATRRKNNTVNTTTPESIAKQKETRRKNNTMNTTTPESLARGWATRRSNAEKKKLSSQNLIEPVTTNDFDSFFLSFFEL